MVSECASDECHDGRRLGIFLVAGSKRPAGRDQLALAAVRDRQPTAGYGCAVSGYHHPFTAAYQKMFDSNPRIGFLAHARQMISEIPANPAGAHELSRLAFNDRLDAFVTAVLVVLVIVIVFEAMLEWARVLLGKKNAEISEAPFVRSQFAIE